MSKTTNNHGGALSRRRTGSPVAALVLAALCIAATGVAAQEWDLTVGAGFFVDSVYAGSDDDYVSPLITFRAAYSRRQYSYFVSLLEGAGVAYTAPDGRIAASLAVGMGAKRDRAKYSGMGFDADHSDRTRELLAGTPNLKTLASTRATLAYRTRVGTFGAAVEYHPTSVETGLPGVEDAVRHGFLCSMSFTRGIPVTSRMAITGMLGLEFMDHDYAQAWYSVERPTEVLGVFDAGAGLRDARAAVQVGYALSPRVAATLIFADTMLLQDARRSPYTVDDHQRTLCLIAVYGF